MIEKYDDDVFVGDDKRVGPEREGYYWYWGECQHAECTYKNHNNSFYSSFIYKKVDYNVVPKKPQPKRQLEPGWYRVLTPLCLKPIMRYRGDDGMSYKDEDKVCAAHSNGKVIIFDEAYKGYERITGFEKVEKP